MIKQKPHLTNSDCYTITDPELVYFYKSNSSIKFDKAQQLLVELLKKYYQKNDNFIATINFEDGSLASLTYSALGAKDFDKEIADIYFDGKIAVIKDYKQLDLYGLKTKGIKSSIQNKGHFEEIKCFAEAIKTLLTRLESEQTLRSRCHHQAENFPWSSTISQMLSLSSQRTLRVA